MKKIIMTLCCMGFPVLAALAAEVFNAGVPGDNTDQIRARFQTDVLDRAPDLVVLMAGTNDSLNSWNSIPVERSERNLDELIKRAREAGAQVILLEIPDALESYVLARHGREFFAAKSVAARIAGLNAAVARLGQRHGVPVVNTRKLLGPASFGRLSRIRNAANCGTADGVHPTPAGYRIIAGAVADVIRREKWEPERVVCVGDSITRGVHVAENENYPARLAQLLREPPAVRGRITRADNGVGIPGILVSDGYNFTRSDASGGYKLKCRREGGRVMVHLPSEFRAEVWHRRAVKTESVDFILQEVPVGDKVRFGQISDTETEQMEWIPGLKKLVANSRLDFLVHTGDICRFPAIAIHAGQLNSGTMGLPVRYVVGNHDLVAPRADGKNYLDFLDPYWYSFEVAGVLFIAAPIHYGEVPLPYGATDFGDYLTRLLKEFPARQPKVILAHELLDYGEFPRIKTSGEPIDLAGCNVIGWFFGHWHHNGVKRHESGLRSFSVSPVNHGGIDHSPAACRITEIDRDGTIRSELVWAPAPRLVELTTPNGTVVARSADGSIALSVLAYDGAAEVRQVTAAVRFDGSDREFPVKLAAGSRWSRQGVLPFDETGASGGEIRYSATFADGSTVSKRARFDLAAEPELPFLRWIAAMPAENLMTAPIVSDGRVFCAVIDDGNAELGGIHAFHAETGAPLWSARTEYSIKHHIASGGGRVFGLDSRGNLHALNAADGTAAWSVPAHGPGLPHQSGGVTYDGGTLYYGNRDELCARDAATGKLRWRVTDWVHGEATPARPTVAGGRLFAVGYWHGIVCYRASDGQLIWANTDDQLRTQAASPVEVDGELFVKGGERLYVLDPATGRILRRSEPLGALESAAVPLVLEDSVIVGTVSAGVLALDRKTLSKRWQFGLSPQAIDTPPYRHGAPALEASPVRLGNMVAVAAGDGTISLLNPADGTLLRQIRTGAPFYASPAAVGDRLYCSDFAGRVLAFSAAAVW